MDYRVLAFRKSMKRLDEDRATAMMIVLEHCHPGHLGQLPPCPGVLLKKAALLGLL